MGDGVHLIDADDFHGVQILWDFIEQYGAPDGTITYSDWANHEWNLPLMTMTDYETLKSYQGKYVPSVTTNSHEDQTDFETYTTAILETVVNSLQSGIVAVDVTINFKILLTSGQT